MRLIDADAFIKRIYEDGKKSNNPSLMMLVGFVTGHVNKQPEAIVRCKDCKHWWYGNYCEKHNKGQENANWFCADGERETD